MSKHESALRETYLRCQESLQQKESLNKLQKSMELKQKTRCIEQESSNEAHMLITTNQESIDLGVTIKQESLEPNDDNAISTFASVWVKVEEENNSASATYEPEELSGKNNSNESSGSPLEEDSPSTIRDSTEEPLNKKPRISVAVERLSAKGELNHAISSILGTPAVLSPIHSQCPTSKEKTRKAKKEIKCSQCDYTTGYKNCFALHMLSHNETKPYSCSTCDYSTKYPTSLSRHMVMKHQALGQEIEDPNQVYKCPYCDYTTTIKWNLNSHKRKHKLKQFKCQQCDYETAYRHNFVKHSKTHEKKNEFYKCDKCPFVTRFEGHISRHLAKIHNEVTDKANMCDYCDFSTPIKWRLNVHKQRSRQAYTMKCSFCEFETYYMCQRKRHKFTHFDEIYKNKSNDTQMITDPIKTSSVVKNNEQNTVAAIENTEELIEYEEYVPEEDKTDAKSQEYTLDPDCVNWKSIQVLYTDGKDKPFQCHMCDFTARFKSSVQRHFQRQHTGAQSRPYKCVNCDFSTKTKDQIALHNKRSKSETILHCNSCVFTTIFKCQYVTHQKSHYSNKCPKCSYTCKHKYELQKHFTTVHMGDGLKCQFCEYKASRKESLLCHETTHTGDKPFKCTYCSYMSVRRCLLDNHIRRNHSEKINVTVVSDSKIQSLKLKPENVQELVQLELTNFK